MALFDNMEIGKQLRAVRISKTLFKVRDQVDAGDYRTVDLGARRHVLVIPFRNQDIHAIITTDGGLLSLETRFILPVDVEKLEKDNLMTSLIPRKLRRRSQVKVGNGTTINCIRWGKIHVQGFLGLINLYFTFSLKFPILPIHKLSIGP